MTPSDRSQSISSLRQNMSQRFPLNFPQTSPHHFYAVCLRNAFVTKQIVANRSKSP